MVGTILSRSEAIERLQRLAAVTSCLARHAYASDPVKRLVTSCGEILPAVSARRARRCF